MGNISEYTETEQACLGCMGPCGMCGPIETFLTVNAKDIPPTDRAKLREAAAKAIQDEKAGIDLAHCPAHLRDAFRRVVVVEAYKRRVNGQIVNPKIEYLP